MGNVIYIRETADERRAYFRDKGAELREFIVRKPATHFQRFEAKMNEVRLALTPKSYDWSPPSAA